MKVSFIYEKKNVKISRFDPTNKERLIGLLVWRNPIEDWSLYGDHNHISRIAKVIREWVDHQMKQVRKAGFSNLRSVANNTLTSYDMHDLESITKDELQNFKEIFTMVI